MGVLVELHCVFIMHAGKQLRKEAKMHDTHAWCKLDMTRGLATE